MPLADAAFARAVGEQAYAFGEGGASQLERDAGARPLKAQRRRGDHSAHPHRSGAHAQPPAPPGDGLAETVRDMQDFDLDLIVPGRCTGFLAVHALLNEFGDGVMVPSAVGHFHVF